MLRHFVDHECVTRIVDASTTPLLTPPLLLRVPLASRPELAHALGATGSHTVRAHLVRFTESWYLVVHLNHEDAIYPISELLREVEEFSPTLVVSPQAELTLRVSKGSVEVRLTLEWLSELYGLVGDPSGDGVWLARSLSPGRFPSAFRIVPDIHQTLWYLEL